MGDGADDAREAEELSEFRDPVQEETVTTETERKPVGEMTTEECWAELGEWLKLYPEDATIAQYQGQSMTTPQLRDVVASYRARDVEEPAVEVEAEVIAEEDVHAAAPTPGAADTARLEDELGKALALREESVQPVAALPSPAEWNASLAIANEIAKTSFVPESYRGRPADVVAAILFGRELGLGPMTAMRDIHMIDGRPALAAHRQLALLRKGGVILLESESTAERAFIKARRSDTGEVMAVEFTYDEATRIQRKGKRLVDGDNWRNYPADMLWARCVGRLTRRLGPDLLNGLPPYVAEEVADFSGWGAEYGAEGAVSFRKANEKPSPKSWPEIFEWANPYGPSLGWPDWVRDAGEALYGTRVRQELTDEQMGKLGKFAAAAIVALRDARDPGEMPPPDRALIRACWAVAGVTAELPGPAWRLSPDEQDRPEYEAPTEAPTDTPAGPVSAVPDEGDAETAPTRSDGAWPDDPPEDDA